ncbi:MAG: ATP phosphoribosyltransferase [Actinomycetaceae bacterium]|nr:ATP phosphoribosyltransferase [Actinomycetaceae bacterium]
MLRIALPNKGSLSQASWDLLSEAGYKQKRDSRKLVLVDKDNDVEFFFIRPRDVAVYVGAGTVDAGITGRDLLLDSGALAIEHLPLGFARSTFRFAAPAKAGFRDIKDVQNKRIATSFDRVVARFLEEHNIEAKDIVHLDGAVESSVELGVADVIADVVETGSTLRAAGLEVFGEELLSSEAILIRRNIPELPQGLERLTRRIQGVLVARQYVMCDYDCPEAVLNEAIKLTPGLQSPTVSPLHENGWFAVRAMVKKTEINTTMDALDTLGAKAIIATPILTCRI